MRPPWSFRTRPAVRSGSRRPTRRIWQLFWRASALPGTGPSSWPFDRPSSGRQTGFRLGVQVMARILLSALAALALTACATAPTRYQPATGPAAVGYSEFRLEPGRYRITFRGGPGAPPQQVADYALLRAAELALAEGYDWFRVADRIVRQEGGGSGPRISLGAGGADFGRRSSVGV